MKNYGLLASSIILSGALLLTGCSSQPGDAKDNVQPSTNGQSTENPDAMPTSYKNLGGAKDWKVDGERGIEDGSSSVVLTPTPMAEPSEFDINAPAEPAPAPEVKEGVTGEGGTPIGFEQAKTLQAPTDSSTELKATEPFIINASGFKPNTIVYAHLYYKDAEENGDVITNGIADEKGNVSIMGYVPEGFKSDANYIVRSSGVNGADEGIFYQTPIRIVK